ncbi:MAG: DDE-type integrase/transposase/recombinase [Deinococcus sp.]|nr:DDE-type integrase/transposase/recombinase [Deinococcus sp.]
MTAVDLCSREADVMLAPARTAHEGSRFLPQSMDRRFDHYVQLMQTDGGPECKDHFRTHVCNYCARYRIARPYKKNEQASIESFNRTLRKECVGWGKYHQEEITALTLVVEAFLEWYRGQLPRQYSRRVGFPTGWRSLPWP